MNTIKIKINIGSGEIKNVTGCLIKGLRQAGTYFFTDGESYFDLVFISEKKMFKFAD